MNRKEFMKPAVLPGKGRKKAIPSNFQLGLSLFAALTPKSKRMVLKPQEHQIIIPTQRSMHVVKYAYPVIVLV